MTRSYWLELWSLVTCSASARALSDSDPRSRYAAFSSGALKTYGSFRSSFGVRLGRYETTEYVWPGLSRSCVLQVPSASSRSEETGADRLWMGYAALMTAGIDPTPRQPRTKAPRVFRGAGGRSRGGTYG